jgi:hypothetical protein
MSLPPRSPHDVSLARGGLFEQLLRKGRLVRGDGHDLRRKIVAVVALGWFPLLVFAGLEVLQGRTPDRLAFHVSVHARTLLAVPLWLVAESVLDRTCSRTLRRFVDENLAERGAVEQISRRANRWRVAWWPEAVLLAGALVLGQLTLWRSSGASGLLDGAGGEAPTPFSFSRAWYASVSLPLFTFLLARTVWRWVLWVQVLRGLSALPLRIVPTHPDRAGGIAFVTGAAAALTPAVLAASSVLAATWGDQILAGAATFREFKIPMVAFLVIAETVALGPSLLFTGQLFRTRLRGLRQYGKLALTYTRSFHERWVEPGPTGTSGEPLLGTPDIQSLADLANSHSLVERMKPVPVGRRAILLVALGVFLPMLPLAATERSLVDILRTLGRPLLGGLP